MRKDDRRLFAPTVFLCQIKLLLAINTLILDAAHLT